MRLACCATLLILLAGCSIARDPIVERNDGDDARYNRDIEACRKSMPIGITNPVADCMTRRGYKVLFAK